MGERKGVGVREVQLSLQHTLLVLLLIDCLLCLLNLLVLHELLLLVLHEGLLGLQMKMQPKGREVGRKFKGSQRFQLRSHVPAPPNARKAHRPPTSCGDGVTTRMFNLTSDGCHKPWAH